MMRTLSAILALFSLALNAQVGKQLASTENFYLYGGKNFDELRSIKELPGKAYIAAGTSSSFGQGNTSAYLIKTDSAGKHVWSYPYGGSQNDWAFSVEATADSGYFVTGFSNSFVASNGYDGWCFKTDKNGVMQWQETIGGNDWEFLYGSAPMWDGGYILCGETFTNSNGSSDAYLVRVGKNGDTLWTRNYGGAKEEKFNSVCVIGNHIFAAGVHYSSSTDSASNAWVVKLDTNGNFISDKLYAGAYHHGDEFLGITPYDGGSFFVCGGVMLVDSNAQQTLIAKMDTALNFMNGPFLDGAMSPGNYRSFSQVINTSYGNISVVGSATGGWGGHNLFIVGFSGSLVFINDFAHKCGLKYDEHGYSGIYTSSGRLIFAGSAQSLCPSNAGLGNEDAFLVRFDSDSITNAGITQTQTTCFADTLFYWAVDVAEHSSGADLRIYPNPASQDLHILLESNTSEEVSVSICTLLGSELMRVKTTTNQPLLLDLSSLDQGAYLLRVYERGQPERTAKFIIGR